MCTRCSVSIALEYGCLGETAKYYLEDKEAKASAHFLSISGSRLGAGLEVEVRVRMVRNKDSFTHPVSLCVSQMFWKEWEHVLPKTTALSFEGWQLKVGVMSQR